MKKPAWRDAGSSGDKSRIAGGITLDLTPALGNNATRISLTDDLAQQIQFLQAFYGAVAFLTPRTCACCETLLPEGVRDRLSVGVLDSAPIIFFLCSKCFEAGLRGEEEVHDRVYGRIDAAASLQAQLARSATA